MRSVRLRASRWGRLQILLVLLLATAPAAAAADPGAEERVAWPAIASLVDRHPGLAAGALRVDAARAGVEAAGAAPNPELAGEVGTAAPRGGGASEIIWGLSLNIPLGWLAQRGSRVAGAEAEVDLAAAEAAAFRRDVLLALEIRFWGLAHAQASLASLESLAAQSAALVETVRKRVGSGEARPAETIRIEVERERVESELETARAALSARQAELALWIGAPSDRAIVAVADLKALPSAPDRESVMVRFRGTHPALAAARARIRARAAEIDVERRARVPSFAISGFVAHELDARGYGGGVAVDLPIWSWNAGRVAQAEARHAAAAKQAEADRLQLEEAVIEAHATCRASVATATRFQHNVLPRSEAAAAAVEKMYEIGEASLLEAIDARRTLIETRRLHLDALAQAHIECGRLGALIGEEPR